MPEVIFTGPAGRLEGRFHQSATRGAPLAIINDGIIQHMRVGACAGLGVKYLAREDAKTVGIFGSGGMARRRASACR